MIKTTQKLVIARSISAFGSSFSDFILPLFIYETTKSPGLLASQWAINALSKFTAGKISGRFHILQSNKQAIILLDVLQGLSALLPFIFWNSFPTIGTFLAGVLISFFLTIQIGYLDSSIVKMTDHNEEKTKIRSGINASLENGKNIGQFSGYLCAWALSTIVGYKLAIFIDSLTFFISAFITLTIIDHTRHDLNSKVKESFSLLFQNKSVSLLTISQGFLSFTIFIYNSSFIFTLKNHFNAPDSAIAVFLTSQALMYIFGSYLAKRYRELSMNWHLYYRTAYFFIFIGFFISRNYNHFLVLNCLLSLLVSFTQPKIMALFQSFSNSENSRSMGSSRASLMAIAGLFGSVLCGLISKLNIDYQFVFLAASFTSFISIVLFKFFIGVFKIRTS
jgi:hypothetical protein